MAAAPAPPAVAEMRKYVGELLLQRGRLGPVGDYKVGEPGATLTLPKLPKQARPLGLSLAGLNFGCKSSSGPGAAPDGSVRRCGDAAGDQ